MKASPFKFYARTLIASRAEDGSLRIEGIASSTVRDLHGDRITEKALKKMARSAEGMTIFMDHKYENEDVFGKVEKSRAVKTTDIDKDTGAQIWDMHFGIRVAKSNPRAVNTFNLIDADQIKLGLSIGAMIPEDQAVYDAKTKSVVIDDADIIETSVVPLPANPRSWVDYAMKSLTGVFPDRMAVEKRAGLTELFGDMDDEMRLKIAGEYSELQEHPGTGVPMEGVEVPADGTMHELVVDDQSLPPAPKLETDPPPDPKVKQILKGVVGIEILDITSEDLELLKTNGQHPHAHVHDHEHEHGWEGNKTVHSHEHAHQHSHEHADDHEHQDGFNDYQHQHDHNDGYETDHAHEGTAAAGEKTKAVVPDVAKTTVTVWDDDKVVEVNTGRAKPKPDGADSAQSSTEPAASKASTKAVTESDEGPLSLATKALDVSTSMLKAVHAELATARAENVTLLAERDAAIRAATKAMEGTQMLIAKLGETPMGRKTLFIEVTKGFDDLSAIYDDSVRKMMTT